VQTVTGLGTGFTLEESHKTNNNSNVVFRVTGPQPESFSTSLYYYESSGLRRLADGATAVYDNSYSKGLDINDAVEINNWDENIAIASNKQHLALESRPVIEKIDELPLFMNNMKQRKYEFDFVPTNFTNKNLSAELVDNYLGTKTLLSVKDPVTVSFDVTSDPKSSVSDRFKIVFNDITKPVATDTKPLVNVYPNPMTGGKLSIALNGLDAGLYNVLLYNSTGQVVLKTQLIHGAGNETKTISVTNIGAGNYRLFVEGENARFVVPVIKN
jgi:hypothetical protein